MKQGLFKKELGSPHVGVLHRAHPDARHQAILGKTEKPVGRKGGHRNASVDLKGKVENENQI